MEWEISLLQSMLIQQVCTCSTVPASDGNSYFTFTVWNRQLVDPLRYFHIIKSSPFYVYREQNKSHSKPCFVIRETVLLCVILYLATNFRTTWALRICHSADVRFFSYAGYISLRRRLNTC
jgi:hypothetical protein